jgi:hypothetical protein
MRKLLLATLALGLVATAAMAAPPQPPSPDQPGQAADFGPHGGPGGPGGPFGHFPPPPPPPPPSKAAHFRLHKGPIDIDVKCADDDTSAACGQVVLQMIDKLQADQAK